MKKWNLAIRYLTFTYIIGGLSYGLTGTIYRIFLGKEVVFSHLLGIILDVIGWPWMIYADLKNIGVMPQDVLTPLAIIICIIIMIKKKTHPSGAE